MSSGVHHPAVAKHDNVQRRVHSAAMKHTLKSVFKQAKFESTQSVASADSTSSNVHHK